MTAKINFSKLVKEYPIADWVKAVAKGKKSFLAKKRSRKATKEEYYFSKK